MYKKILLISVLVILCLITLVFSEVRYFRLPPLAPPERYGNVLIDRTSSESGVKAVSFSHWMHRVKYTCRVCHSELGFKFETNATVITEQENRDGNYCGACHNGKTAFGHKEEHCHKCHNGDIGWASDRFKDLKTLPGAAYGNEIDWVLAIKKGMIKPADYIKDDRIPIHSIKNITLYSRWMYMYSDAHFPHEPHGDWVGCSSCHPDIFSYEARQTEDLSMINILNRKFCGICHGKVAFPFNDCRRCHPTMKYSGIENNEHIHGS